MEVNPGRMRQQPSAGGGGRPGFGTNALPPRWDDRKKIDCSFLHAARQLAPLPSSRNRERRLFYTPAPGQLLRARCVFQFVRVEC